MKNNKTKTTDKKNRKHSPNVYSNNEGKETYNLQDYRNKKRNYYNPYGNEKDTKQESTRTNPYRKQYTNNKTSNYQSPYEESYKRPSKTYENPYENPYSDLKSQQRTRGTSSRNSYENSYDSSYDNPYGETYSSYYVSNTRSVDAKTPEERKAELRSKNKMTRQEVQRQNKRRKRRIIKKIAMLMVMVMFISYAAIRLLDFFMYPSVSYQTVQQGVIDNSHLYQGIIFRDESVYKSSKTGDIHYLIGEGEKVGKDGSVCLVAQSSEIEALKKQLYSIDNTLYNKQDKRSDLSYYQGDVKQVNEVLKMEMANFIDSKYWENPKSVYALRQSLDKTIEERTSIYIQDESKTTQGIKGERGEVLESLKNNQAAIKSPVAGIVSYSLDGYEERLTGETLSKMNLETYKTLTNDLKSLEITMPPLQTEANLPLYKVITSDAWKIVTYVDNEEAVGYEVGKYYNLYFDEAKREYVRFKLESKEEETKTKLVFSSNEYLADFLNMRQVTFSIGQNKAQGIKIPLKAIVEKNMLAIPKEYIVEEGSGKGVLKVTGQANLFTEVNVQYEDEEFAYIMQHIDMLQGVDLGTVIAHPEKQEQYTIDKLNTVQGVYVVNGQFTQFKRIAIEMVNDEYAILKNTKENKLKEFDQIISNPKNIGEDQLLKYMNVQNE